MNHPSSSPPPEGYFYKLLYQLIQQNRGTTDNTGLIVLGMLLAFFAFLTPLIIVTVATPLPHQGESAITNVQSNMNKGQ